MKKFEATFVTGDMYNITGVKVEDCLIPLLGNVTG